MRDALSLIGRYMRTNQPEIARIPTDIGDALPAMIEQIEKVRELVSDTFSYYALPT